MLEEAICLDLLSHDGEVIAKLRVANLPNRHDITISARGEFALREGATYRFEIADAGSVDIEPRELFDPDDDSWTRGRLSPSGAVGCLRVRVVDRATRIAGTADIDVLAIKLDHETEYRQMLTDVSSFATEAALQGFAPSLLDLAPSEMPSELLYLRFALIAAYLQNPMFEAAIAQVTSQPHRTWVSDNEERPVGAPFPSGTNFHRAIRAPGPRVRWQGGPGQLKFLPRSLTLDRTESSVDSPANRFVKFALERWRAIATEMLDVLSQPTQTVETGPLRRGRLAAADVAAKLDEYLALSLFGEVGSLAGIPTSDQVLLKRAGYREIFRTFAMTEAGPTVMINNGDLSDVFAASQRNIATLYEFWCFLALVDSLGRVCGEDRAAQAFTIAGNGLSVTMRSGVNSKVSWTVRRGGRALQVDAFFNRTFNRVDRREGSWSKDMRPDCSIRIRPEGNTPSFVLAKELEVWLHFDAKYRVDSPLVQVATGSDVNEPLTEFNASSSAKREDFLKMHAYRDAISRTAGAYILYPGRGSVIENIQRYPSFEEILPGLGAFPLRPNSDGLTSSSKTLDQFLGDVLAHVASQVTRDERHRFWTATVGRPGGPLLKSPLTTDLLQEPPADTDVLIGFVRNAEHRRWIEESSRYNIRTGDRAGAVEIGGRELGAKLILLYEKRNRSLQVSHVAKVLRWKPSTAADLAASGYPNPRGELYFVAHIELVEQLPAWANLIDLDALLPTVIDNAPAVVTWWDIVRAASTSED